MGFWKSLYVEAHVKSVVWKLVRVWNITLEDRALDFIKFRMRMHAKALYSYLSKVFRIFLVFTFFFQQIAWTMQGNKISSETFHDQSLSSPFLSGEKKTLEVRVVSTIEDYKADPQEEVGKKYDPLPESHKNLGSSRHLKEDEKEILNVEMSPTIDADIVYPSNDTLYHIASDNIQEEGVKDNQDVIQEILKIESTWRGVLRWANIDSLLQRVGYFFVLKADEVTLPDDQKRCCSIPVWLSGGSFPIESMSARKRVLFMDGFRQGAEFVIFRTIHTGITALVIYQLYNYIKEKEPLICQGTPTSKNLEGLWKFWEASDDKVLLGFFHDILGEQNSVLSYLKYLLAAPLAYGVGKGLWNTRNSNISSEEIEISLKELDKFKQPGFYQDTTRWLLPLHPINRKLSGLMKNVLWNRQMTSEDLQRIWAHLQSLATDHDGYTPIHSLGYIMSIIYGLNVYDVRFVRQKSSLHKEDIEETLVEDESTKDASSLINERVYIKDEAVSFLQKFAALQHIKEKRGVLDKVFGAMTALYAKYLLWSLGVSSSWSESTAITLFKAGKLYAQAKLIENIFNAFSQAKKCPQQPGVSIAGVEPWANDLTEKCFRSVIKSFNMLPGQPLITLTSNLNQYHFETCDFELDLSNKDLSEDDIYNITKSLIDHGLTIIKANLTGNLLTKIDFLENLLEEASILDLSYNCIGELGKFVNFSKLPKNLSFLDLSSNQLGSDGSFVNFSALPRSLIYLDLGQNFIQPAKNESTLSGLPETLEHFGFRNNRFCAKGAFINFSLLPKTLLYLDVAFNEIYSSDVESIFAKIPGSISYFDIGFNNINSQKEISFKIFPRRLTHLNIGANQIQSLGDYGNLPSFLTYVCFSFPSSTLIKILNFTGIPYTLSQLVITNSQIGFNNIVEFVGLSSVFNFIDLDSCTINSNGTVIFKGLPSHLRELAIVDCKMGPPNVNIKIMGLPAYLSIFATQRVLLNVNFLELLPNNLKSLWIASNQINFLNTNILNLLPDYINDIALEMCQFTDDVINLEKLPNTVQTLSFSYSTFKNDLINFTMLPHNITSLDLSYANIGVNKIPVFFIYLHNLTNLKTLNIESNYIGYTTEGILNFAKALRYLKNLQYINLANNQIGSTGSEGPEAILSALSELPNFDFNNLNAHGMTNISWSNYTSNLQNSRFSSLMNYCKSSRCFGGDLSPVTNGYQSIEMSHESKEHRFSSPENDWSTPLTSSASRPFSLFASIFKGIKDIAESSSATYMMLGFGAQVLLKAGVPLLLAYSVF